MACLWEHVSLTAAPALARGVFAHSLVVVACAESAPLGSEMNHSTIFVGGRGIERVEQCIDHGVSEGIQPFGSVQDDPVNRALRDGYNLGHIVLPCGAPRESGHREALQLVGSIHRLGPHSILRHFLGARYHHVRMGDPAVGSTSGDARDALRSVSRFPLGNGHEALRIGVLGVDLQSGCRPR